MKDFRVKLVPLDVTHENLIVKWRNHPKQSEFLFSSSSLTLENHRVWFEKYKKSDDRKEFIITIIENEIPIGTVGLSSIDTVNWKAEYGILLGNTDYEGKGYSKEASLLILEYGFKKINLNKIYLRVFLENERAVALYEKIGFKRDGLLRQDIFKSGRFRDVLEMSILKEDWYHV